jgi:hypothetical protein
VEICGTTIRTFLVEICPCSDNDGGFSIEPKNIKERGNLVAHDGGGRFISTQDEQQAHKRELVLLLEIIIQKSVEED